MTRYRLNTTKCVFKWPKKPQKVSKFKNQTLFTLSDPPPLLGLIHILDKLILFKRAVDLFYPVNGTTGKTANLFQPKIL